MHLQSCLNPKRVYNKYIENYIYVPCRKCEACRNVRRLEITSQLEEDCKLYSYVHFFTLTYSNENCPTVTIHHDSGDPAITLSTRLKNIRGDNEFLQVYDLSEEIIKNDWNDYDIEYLNNKDFIRVGSKADVQKFIKRLRKYAQEKYNTSFGYFVTLEYSPKLHRPHYHGVLYHDCRDFAQDFRQILDKTWKLGRTNTTLAGSSALSYVAKYINGFTYLPKVYENAEWRPFFLRSRREAKSASFGSSEEVQDIVFGRINYYIRKRNNEFNAVSFSRSFKDRLFPKCKEFDRSTFIERVTCYRKSEHLYELSKVTGASPLSCFYNYQLNTGNKGLEFSLSDFYISLRVLKLCEIFNVSLEWYVRRIEEYYDYVAQQNLKIQYLFQTDFVDNLQDKRELKYLVTMYPQFLETIKKSVFEEKDFPLDRYIDELKSFGIEKTDIPLIDYKDSAEYKEFSAMHIFIDRDSQKTKKLNEHYINF